eukprot:2954595-Rhodomonas_salina.1
MPGTDRACDASPRKANYPHKVGDVTSGLRHTFIIAMKTDELTRLASVRISRLLLPVRFLSTRCFGGTDVRYAPTRTTGCARRKTSRY